VTRPDIVEYGQRKRRWVGVTAVAVLIVVPIAVILYGRSTSPPLPEAVTAVVPATSAPPTGPPNVVVPRERGDGDTKTIKVTFPNGAAARVEYPAELGLAELGVRPYVGATLSLAGTTEEFRTLAAPYRGEAEIAGNGPMIRRLAGDVTLWPGPPGVPSVGAVLLFRFGDWRIALQDERDGLTFEQRVAWARSLRGRVTADGFLVLSARPPLRLARPGEVRGGVVAGPQLWIGGGTGPLLVLTPTPDCERKALTPLIVKTRPDASGGVCRRGIHLAASGEPEFVRRALAEIRITPG
jgi:hypothetical protein